MAASYELGPPAESRDRVQTLWYAGVAAAAAIVVFLLAYDDGSYALESRNTVAIAAWWGVLLVVLYRPSAARAPAGALAAGGLLLLFTAWTGISAAWSNDTERVVSELDRTALYLGVFVLAVLLAGRGRLPALLDGTALGLTATAALALTSRFLPEIASLPEDTARRLPAATVRLSYPVEYWNGLGILVALAAPLLGRVALAARLPAVRALSVAALPLVGTTIDLTASRGAAAAAALGAVAFVVLASDRWSALAVLVAGTGGSLVAVAGVHALAGDGAAVGAGQAAGVPIVLAGCLLAGIVYAAWDVLLARRFQPGPLVGWVVAGSAVVVAVAAFVASHPVQRFEDFKQPESARESADNDYVRTSFGEASGSGRWQYWSVAWQEFRAAPGKGGGAGSYETWWAQRGTLPREVHDAHSLYLETLAELGLIGFVLLGGVFAVAGAVGVERLRRARAGERVTLAAALACVLAYALGAGIDWVWELPVITLVAVVCLAGLVTPAEEVRPARASRARIVAATAVLAAIALAAIVVEVVPLLEQRELEESRAAARRGDVSHALEHALSARRIAPWASSPYLQLALVDELQADYGTARAWLREAIARDPEDWRLWLVSARIETEAGRIPAARRSLERARELNPRSAVFAGD